MIRINTRRWGTELSLSHNYISDIVSFWELSGFHCLMTDHGRLRKRERESKILLVFSYSRWVSWLCLSWAKHAKPDKYNVAAELTYTSSDQMSGDNTRSFCSSGFRQQTWWCAAVQWWRWWRWWRYDQGTKHYGWLTVQWAKIISFCLCFAWDENGIFPHNNLKSWVPPGTSPKASIIAIWD